MRHGSTTSTESISGACCTKLSHCVQWHATDRLMVLGLPMWTLPCTNSAVFNAELPNLTAAQLSAQSW
jgi:hypothetical protein